LNLYVYVGNDPANSFDPMGLIGIEDVEAAQKASDEAKAAVKAANAFVRTCKDPEELKLAAEAARKALESYELKQARYKEILELWRASRMGGFINPRLLIRGGGVVTAGVIGFTAGRAIGGSTPYPGGGSIDKNIQETDFEPFWDWYYRN
jgi:hypothetical protein